MASQSLYRKWRSQTFNDMVGQEAVVRTLKNALSSGNLAHAYLFTGPRGTGKTTTARLLAKTVNCEHPVDGEPCNQCQQCREITAGNSFNVIEIDAASNRGIDNIRDLREKVMMPPSTGKYKVYVLDEAHMLTTEAFNALLKTLEEPPPRTALIGLVRNPLELLPTVRSRSLILRLAPVAEAELLPWLRRQNVPEPEGGWEAAARLAGGSPGRALGQDWAAYRGLREQALALIAAGLDAAHPRSLFELTARLFPPGRAGKEKLESLLEILYSLLQDMLYVTAGRAAAIRNTDCGAEVAALASRLSLRHLSLAIQEADQMAAAAQRNAQRGLAVEAWALRLGQVPNPAPA